MKPLAKDLRPERGYVFHGDTMKVVDVVVRREIKIRLEQFVYHSIMPAKRPLDQILFWNYYSPRWHV